MGEIELVSAIIKSVRRDAAEIATLLVVVLLVISAAALAESRQNPSAGRIVVRDLPPAMLVATTSSSATEYAAVGQPAKLINAALPFDVAPAEPLGRFSISEADHSRALLCLRAAVYHEAGFEPLAGRQAVAQVILNRVRHPAFPKSICDVVYQGAASKKCQFSFACDEARHRPAAATAWREATDIASAALAGYIQPSVGTSTHYHADYVAPRWAPLLVKVSKVGTHIFYRWPGRWGEREAFARRYAGEQSSAIGRAMELQAATEQVVTLGGGRGLALTEIRDGEIAPEAVRGVNNRGVVIRAGDVWQLGPNERLITATLLARLIDRGLMSWDTPLREVFPDLAPYMRPELQSVTVIQLLSDNSILAARNNPLFAASLTKGANPLTVKRAIFFERALGTSKKSGKGNFSGRSSGLVIAMAAAENVTGHDFEDLAREEIFAPLGMRSAGFARSKGRGGIAPGDRFTRGLDLLRPIGMMHMSLQDFSTFLVDQMKGQSGSGKLFSQAAYRRLHKPPQSERRSTDNKAVQIQPFNSSMFHPGIRYYWIAGANVDPTVSNAVIAMAIPRRENGVGPLRRALNMPALSQR